MKCLHCKGSGFTLADYHKILWLKCTTCKGTGKDNPTSEDLERAVRLQWDNHTAPLHIPEIPQGMKYNTKECDEWAERQRQLKGV